MERSEPQFVITLAVFMLVDDEWHSIFVYTLAQLFPLYSSVARNNRISDSSINSLSLDANAPDQNGELLQFVLSSKNCDIAFDLKVVFTIRMYSSPSRVLPLK